MSARTSRSCGCLMVSGYGGVDLKSNQSSTRAMLVHPAVTDYVPPSAMAALLAGRSESEALRLGRQRMIRVQMILAPVQHSQVWCERRRRRTRIPPHCRRRSMHAIRMAGRCWFLPHFSRWHSRTQEQCDTPYRGCGKLLGSADGEPYHAVDAIPLSGDSTLNDGNWALLFAWTCDH